MEVEVGLHHMFPPSGYTICEHSGTASRVPQFPGLPVEGSLFLVGVVE